MGGWLAPCCLRKLSPQSQWHMVLVTVALATCVLVHGVICAVKIQALWVGTTAPPSAERRKPAPRRACLTWEKYSSEMRAAHSMLCSSGRQGLDTSAHLISMRLIRVRFSGVLSTVFMAACSLSVS